MKVIVNLSLLLILAIAAVTYSQQGLTISGELTDSDGTLVGSDIPVLADVVVNFYEEEDGTVPKYSESFLVSNSQGISVFKGNISVPIGRQDTLGTLNAALSSSSNMWVEMIIDGDVLSRSPVTASPYSIRHNFQLQAQAGK